MSATLNSRYKKAEPDATAAAPQPSESEPTPANNSKFTVNDAKVCPSRLVLFAFHASYLLLVRG